MARAHIIHPTVAPDADRRYTPGPVLVGTPSSKRSARQRLCDARFAVKKKMDRQDRIEKQRVWAMETLRLKSRVHQRLHASPLIYYHEGVPGFSLADLSREMEANVGVLRTRYYRLGIVPLVKLPASQAHPHCLLIIRMDDAITLAIFHSGNQRGRVNNPKRKQTA